MAKSLLEEESTPYFHVDQSSYTVWFDRWIIIFVSQIYDLTETLYTIE
jgi:hypothetical protein